LIVSGRLIPEIGATHTVRPTAGRAPMLLISASDGSFQGIRD